MALFSDVDWVIIAVVAAFLLLGKDSAGTVRMFGRWYGRAMRLKQELLGELTRAADLPMIASGQQLSIRGAILGIDPPVQQVSGIPAAVRVPPSAPFTPTYDPTLPWTGGYPVPTWSTTVPPGPAEREAGR